MPSYLRWRNSIRLSYPIQRVPLLGSKTAMVLLRLYEIMCCTVHLRIHHTHGCSKGGVPLSMVSFRFGQFVDGDPLPVHGDVKLIFLPCVARKNYAPLN